MYDTQDTIAAIATPIGEGGVGLIRLSGPQAIDIARVLFAGVRSEPNWASHRLYYGHIVEPDTRAVVDEVMVSVMKAPRSYTREDVIEIGCHGGPVPLQTVLGLCLRHGARLAEPGEFTLRAFLNGRLDLSQAEAVLDIIHARTEAGLRAAVGQLEGRLSSRVRAIRQELMGALAYLTATIDFTEQEIPPQDIGPGLVSLRDSLLDLLGEAENGIIFRQGVRVAIIGRPNVGKSSLFNALLRANRAIVTPIPGTTRDTVEEILNLRGVPVVLVDTAGFNDQTEDLVERLGVERSRAALNQADLILWVIDGSQSLSDTERALAGLLNGRPAVIVVNKVDLPGRADLGELSTAAPPVPLSALTGAGLADLEEAMLRLILGGKVISADGPLVSNPRHEQALQRALDHVQAALCAYQQGWPTDAVTIDLTLGGEALGEITGETVSDDLLQTIFSQFCIGK